MAEASWETFPGLNAILESPRWSITKSSQAVEACIDANRDNLRGFFEQCFSLLLKCTFGYEGSSWLNSLGKGGPDSDVKALVSLFSPGGRLLQAIHAADADSLIKFMFPSERLPTHTQLLLVAEIGRQELATWPQYARQIVRGPGGRPAIHLDVFGYFVFWTAFYVLRGSQTIAPTPIAPRHGLRAVSAIAPSLGTVRKTLRLGKGHQVEGHAYLRLLRLYLEQYLPRTAQHKASKDALSVASPVRRARARHSIAGNEGAILLGVLLEFWLSDGDQPLPPGPGQDSLTGASQGFADPWGQGSAVNSVGMRTYDAPSEDLTEALMLLTRYVYSLEDEHDARNALKPAQSSGFAWLPATPQPPAAPAMMQTIRGAPSPHRLGSAASAPAQAFGKRLFRFLYRALTRWPEQRPLTPIINLWLAAVAPWWPPSADSQGPWQPTPAQGASGFSQRDAGEAGIDLTRKLSGVMNRVQSINPSRTQGNRSAENTLDTHYTVEWEAHVLSNLPMWRVLLPLFLDQMLSRVSSQGDAALIDLLNVLRVLQAAPGLVSLLKGVEIALAPTGLARGPQARRDSAAFADLIPFLTDQAQEWAATACATLDTSAPVPTMPEMHMFAEGLSGGAARVRAVLKAAKGAVREDLLNATASAASSVLPMSSLPQSMSPDKARRRPESLSVQGALKKGRWEDLHYKGDWMRRPISSNEIGWLVRLLLHLSDFLNRVLYLQGPDLPSPPSPSFPLRMLLALHNTARSRGWRINLRPFAEIQILLWTPILLLITWSCWHLLMLIWEGLSAPDDGTSTAIQPAIQHVQRQGHWHPAHAHHLHHEQTHDPASSAQDQVHP